MSADTVIYNVHLATCCPADTTPSAVLRDASLAMAAGRIVHVGRATDAPAAAEQIDGNGAWLTPGFIDCHTHLVYGGNRAVEFAERLRGVPYEEIARRGGGLLSTVSATRTADEQSLFDQSLPRLLALAQEGVTTIEIKSGYGLDVENEIKMLSVARQLGRATGLHNANT